MVNVVMNVKANYQIAKFINKRKGTMPSFCVVSNCEHKYTHAENVSFHRFPYQSPEILDKWIKFSDRDPQWKPSRWSAICSRHFLPSDFRNSLTRKCLKKDAVPSITIKQFNGNLLEFATESSDHIDLKVGCEILATSEEHDFESNCRLCGLCCKSVETIAANFEIFGLIQKCFPMLNIQQDDELPKNVCPACLDRLHLFSDFIDEVLKTQQELFAKFNSSIHIMSDTPIGKTLKIKQEPVIIVKQEVNDIVQSSPSEDCDNEANEEQEDCDQKSQLHNNLAIINSAEIIKNCDVMEIITLDDAFIDIPDDEVGEDESGPAESMKVQPIEIPGEHNYARSCGIDETTEPFRHCKTESSEEAEIQIGNAKIPNIIVIDESIVQSVPSASYYQCGSCPNTFIDESNLIEHINLYHTPAARKCVACNLQFDSFYNYLKHKSKFHKISLKKLKKKTSFNCRFCEKVFTSKLALNNHIKYICDQRCKQEEEYDCKNCGKKLSNQILLRHHEKICIKSEANDIIENSEGETKSSSISTMLPTFPTSNSPPKSQSSPHEKGPFLCPICGRSYSRRHNLFKHQVMHRPPSLWNHKCGDCNQLFDHIYDLRRHLKNEECSRNNKVSGADVDDDQKPPQQLFFICTICGKQLKTLQRLKQHSVLHSGKRPYVCESCGKSFANVNNLYQHRVTHSDVRRYKCDLCEKVFKRRGGLNQHKRAYHLKIKPHECPTCKHRFALKGDMTRCKHSVLRH